MEGEVVITEESTGSLFCELTDYLFGSTERASIQTVILNEPITEKFPFTSAGVIVLFY